MNETSKNSSLPPSTEGVKKTKSLREPSNKEPRGQAGHKGTTLKIVRNQDVIVKYVPRVCQRCGENSENIAG